jgi:hypothetical protein
MADNGVFSPILKLPTPQLTEAVYQLLLVLRHRNFLQQGEISALLDAASFQSPIDPDGHLRGTIESSLFAIEAQEHKSLREIPDEHLQKYQQELSSLLSNRVQSHLADSNLSGVELLKQFG